MGCLRLLECPENKNLMFWITEHPLHVQTIARVAFCPKMSTSFNSCWRCLNCLSSEPYKWPLDPISNPSIVVGLVKICKVRLRPVFWQRRSNSMYSSHQHRGICGFLMFM